MYLGLLAKEINAWGGDAGKIKASGTGWPERSKKPRPGHSHDDYHRQLTGKIEGLIYDHFGDFEGFILEVENGERIHFFSREKNIEGIVYRAWTDRTRITVIPEDKNEYQPRRLILHPH